MIYEKRVAQLLGDATAWSSYWGERATSYTHEEIMDTLNVSKSTAYRLMRKFAAESFCTLSQSEFGTLLEVRPYTVTVDDPVLMHVFAESNRRGLMQCVNIFGENTNNVLRGIHE